jgi:hypothetical protein
MKRNLCESKRKSVTTRDRLEAYGRERNYAKWYKNFKESSLYKIVCEEGAYETN